MLFVLLPMLWVSADRRVPAALARNGMRERKLIIHAKICLKIWSLPNYLRTVARGAKHGKTVTFYFAGAGRPECSHTVVDYP